MVGPGCFVSLCLYTVITVTASPNDSNEITILKHQLKQLEETVSNLQKHIVAQDQKQSAVLSTVLSRLTETSNKLNETTNKLTETTDKLMETTDELARLQHNHTVLENEFSSLMNYTLVSGARKGVSRQEVAFEATMVVKGDQNHYRKFLENSTLIFPTINYNEGGCWNSSTGVFTATVNGFYLFWIDLTFTGVKGFTLSMKKNDQNFARAFGRLPDPAETAMTSRISLTQLVEGDLVQFVANKNVNYLPIISSCGGVLLYSDIQ